MSELLLTVVVVVSVTALFSFISLKQKQDEWEGILVGKKFNHGDEDSRDIFILTFKTSQGKKKKFTLYDKKTFDSWNEGDKATKVKGNYFPIKP